jgi:pyruvate/2-oxoglutarate dehydrogenase complex dihydrolipoamide acyltransferase (E2) component
MEEILMPKLSDTMIEGIIAAWHKKIGDVIKKGDLLVEIETDKATMEVESYKEGVLLYVAGEEGAKLQVNSLLAVIGNSTEHMQKAIKEIAERTKLLEQQKKQFEDKKNEVIREFDENGDGNVSIVREDDFMEILNEYQIDLIKIDRSYVRDFVKVANYLKTKRENIQKFFQSLKTSIAEQEFENKEVTLKNQIYSYQLLLFHAINMIIALLEDNMVAFYEIHEAFDKLSIFNSNWENDVSKKLSSIESKLDDLITAINKVEYSISEELNNLNYITQKSFSNFQIIVDEYLESIDSSIRTNNLLNLIQVYQLHNINKHRNRIE